jgi:LysM repeat protein
LPSPTQSGLASNCDAFHLVASGDTCAAIETEYGITAAEFSTWNPAINSGKPHLPCLLTNAEISCILTSFPACGNLFLGYYVCVGVPGVTTTTAPTTTTSSGPSPQMPSLISTCDKYYQVASGDGCASIETAEGITAAEFALWNPYVDATCSNLWLGYYICVGVATVTTTTAPTTTATATSTGPSPQMPSLISTCDKYYLVASGDGCDSIETKEGITAAEFALWNPYVDATCGNLWLGYYICVGV